MEGDNQQPDLSRVIILKCTEMLKHCVRARTNMGLQVNHTSKANVQTYRKEIYFVVTRSSVEEGVEGSQKVQTSSYKTNMNQGCKVQHGKHN